MKIPAIQVVSTWKLVEPEVAELKASDNGNGVRAMIEQQEFADVCAM
jgi:hypothetical protein